MGNVKEKKHAVLNLLIIMFSNMGIDTPMNHEEIVDFVFNDVNETADPENWHSGDVAIGFRRWIEAQAMSDTNVRNDEVRDTLIPVPDLGDTLLTVGQVRGIMSDLDDHDHVCVEACDEHGDVEDLYPMSMDVIEGIELVDKTIVREVRFCQRPNTEPDTRPKQPVVDALIDVLADDIAKGDTTVLDELLLRMPFDVLKYALPEDMWADFEENVQPDNLKP